jgi:hypothetical protein
MGTDDVIDGWRIAPAHGAGDPHIVLTACSEYPSVTFCASFGTESQLPQLVRGQDIYTTLVENDIRSSF